MLVACVVALGGITACGLYKQNLRKEIYLIPKETAGWFVVVFDQKDWPPLETEEGADVYRLSTDKLLITSTKLREDPFHAEFYLVDGTGGRVRLTTSLTGGGGQVWGDHTFSIRTIGKVDVSGYCFFVGSEDALKRSSEKELDERIELAREKLKQPTAGATGSHPSN